MRAEFGIFPVITSVGAPEFPEEHRVDNKMLIERALEAGAPYAADLTPEDIEQRAGVESRYWLEGVNVVGLAIEAAQSALEGSPGVAGRLGKIIVATGHPSTPSHAAYVHAAVGAPEACQTFDLSAACAGFSAALTQACDTMDANPDLEASLVVGIDCPTPGQHLDITDKGTALILGGGAAAVVIEQRPDARRPVHASLSRPNLAIVGKSSWEDPLRMQGGRVVLQGKTMLPLVIKMAAQKTGLTRIDEAGEPQIDWPRLDKLFVHQASELILNVVGQEIGAPDNKVPRYALRKYGNTSAATVPLNMHEAYQRGELDGQQTISYAGLGAGLLAVSGIIETRL